MTTLGERLRIARDRKGLTQVQVKSRTNINNKTLSGYEKDVSEPDTKTLSLLADLYEVDYRWLLTGEGGMDPVEVDQLTDEEIDKEIQEITKELTVWYKDEPDDKREKLKRLRKINKTFTDEN